MKERTVPTSPLTKGGPQGGRRSRASRADHAVLENREVAQVYFAIEVEVRKRSAFRIDGNRNSPRARAGARGAHNDP